MLCVIILWTLSIHIGKRSIDIIQDCSCATPYCYRVSSFEAFPEQYTDAKGEKAVRTKVCM